MTELVFATAGPPAAADDGGTGPGAGTRRSRPAGGTYPTPGGAAEWPARREPAIDRPSGAWRVVPRHPSIVSQSPGPWPTVPASPSVAPFDPILGPPYYQT